jgi:hypothetical protein
MTRAQRTDSRPKVTRSRPTPRWLTKKTDLDAVARNRVLMVLAVLSGAKPVSTAIVEAGVSRGFYYQLETKAINAMLLALAPGSDGDASPDATGLHHRIKELEARVTRAEQDKRRAERLLYVQRKVMGTGPVKTARGRPSKTTSSTKGGQRGWRSSTKPTRKTLPVSSTGATPTPATSSTPTPISDGTNADP